jgi:hypothetical protein
MLFWPSVAVRHPFAAFIYPLGAVLNLVVAVLSFIEGEHREALSFFVIGVLSWQCYRITRQVAIYQMLMFGSESVEDREETL